MQEYTEFGGHLFPNILINPAFDFGLKIIGIVVLVVLVLYMLLMPCIIIEVVRREIRKFKDEQNKVNSEIKTYLVETTPYPVDEKV